MGAMVSEAGQAKLKRRYADIESEVMAADLVLAAPPKADVEGYDVRLKVVILANQLLGASLTPADVACKGISALGPEDIVAAAGEGARWKLIGSAVRGEDGRIEASVTPRRLALDHPLAGVNGVTNAVSFMTEMLGAVTVTGPGAGRIETAYALLSDIIAIHRTASSRQNKEAAE